MSPKVRDACQRFVDELLRLNDDRVRNASKRDSNATTEQQQAMDFEALDAQRTQLVLTVIRGALEGP